MPAFAFEALAVGGTKTSGLIDAETQRHARQLLRARGLYPTRIDPGQRERRAPDPAGLPLATRQLSTLLAADLPVAEALDTLVEIERGTAWEATWTAVRANVGAGSALADALRSTGGTFPATYVALVRAGETSGTLPVVLQRLADQLEAHAATRAQVRSALTYPAIMLTVTAIMLGGLLVWVVPQLTQLVQDTHTTLPLATRLLLGGVAVLQRGWWLLALAGIAAGAAVRAWIATPAGRATADALWLRLPLVGPLVRAAATARVARTLGALTASAVPIDVALTHAAAAAGNTPIAAAVVTAGHDLTRGQSLAAALQKTGVFPPIVLRLAATGERGGTLAAGLERAADTLDAEVTRRIRALTALVEPALILLMGGVVLGLVLAILLPLMTVSAGGPE